MSAKRLLIVWLLALFVLFWPDPANAFQQSDRKEEKTKVLAKLKRGDFVRVRTAFQGEVKGHVRSFDGRSLILREQRFTHSHEVIVDASDIVQIKTGRGFLGSLRYGFTEPARILSWPVTSLIFAYQMGKAMDALM